VDTAVLHDLLAATGPFASVYFDGSHDTEDAAKEFELRWRAAREMLAEADANERMLGALDEAVRSGPPAVGRAGRFLIAADETVLVDEYLSAVPANPVVRLSARPYLMPLATQSPPRVPHVVVLVDKIGADLRAVDADGEVIAEYTVDGQSQPVHKVPGGGWSHRNIQQHAEETVKHNIARVAAETAQLGQEAGARLIVLAGDVEPRTMLRRAIPPFCAQIAVELEHGGRGAMKELADDVAALVVERWQAERGAVLKRFRAELGRDGLAVQGLKPTTEALREANVTTLVISDPAIGDHVVWTGEQPQLVAVEPTELDNFGATERIEGRADEVLPAAAVAIGADLMSDDERLGDGVGALLRHNGGGIG
jgi:hypothetical protein